MPYWHFMDWAGVGRHGEASPLNAQLAGAFLAAGDMAEVVGWPSEAERCRARAHSLARALEARHWEERRGAYVDVVDPATGAQEPRMSQHGNAAITLWGEPSAARAARALDRITDSARLTFTPGPPVAPHGTPLDAEAGVVLANTFYSHFVYEALGKHGRFAEALRQMRERFGPMLERGATTLWESFEPTASLCHGFSASPTYQLSRRLLGQSDVAGWASAVVAPDLAGLEFAEGVVPTTRGDIEVRLDRTASGFHAKVTGAGDLPNSS